jgi:protein-L-isoaspartate(D-aspartate) O-methyltransferase
MGGREYRDSPPVSEASDAAASQARAWMVASQLRTRGIADPRVLEAMAEIPRDWFVETSDRTRAYADEALPIPAGQTISQPYIVARMTELLAPRSGDRILEIGTGSGYQAAVLARLNCHVVSIERQPELATTARERLIERGFGDRVEVRLGDGSAGDPSGAPWDGIIVTAAAPSVPASLREQLRTDGGRLVVPVGNRMRQELIVVVRDGDTWREWNDGQVVFVPLIGEEGFPG